MYELETVIETGEHLSVFGTGDENFAHFLMSP